MPSKIVGIFGQKENGKTTVRKYITEQLYKSHVLFHRMFASLVKEVLEVITGHNAEYLDSIKEEKLPGYALTVRQCYQRIGTLIQQMNPRICIEDALKDYGNGSTINIIVDDGRHEAEAREIREQDGITILVVRPDKLNDDPHDSERWVGDQARIATMLRNDKVHYKSFFDYILWNDGTLEHLYKQINGKLIQRLSTHFVNCRSGK